jgi:hypothetical protein
MSHIIEHRVARFHALHESPQIRGGRFQQKVNMVTHQAKQVQTDSIGFSALGQPEQKPLAVTIISENRLPAIPSDRHMIDRTRKFYSEMSRHSCNLHSKCLACKFYMSSFGLTPAVPVAERSVGRQSRFNPILYSKG